MSKQLAKDILNDFALKRNYQFYEDGLVHNPTMRDVYILAMQTLKTND